MTGAFSGSVARRGEYHTPACHAIGAVASADLKNNLPWRQRHPGLAECRRPKCISLLEAHQVVGGILGGFRSSRLSRASQDASACPTSQCVPLVLRAPWVLHGEIIAHWPGRLGRERPLDCPTPPKRRNSRTTLRNRRRAGPGRPASTTAACGTGTSRSATGTSTRSCSRTPSPRPRVGQGRGTAASRLSAHWSAPWNWRPRPERSPPPTQSRPPGRSGARCTARSHPSSGASCRPRPRGHCVHRSRPSWSWACLSRSEGPSHGPARYRRLTRCNVLGAVVVREAADTVRDLCWQCRVAGQGARARVWRGMRPRATQAFAERLTLAGGPPTLITIQLLASATIDGSPSGSTSRRARRRRSAASGRHRKPR